MRQKRSVNANKTHSLFYETKKDPLTQTKRTLYFMRQKRSVNANKTHSLRYFMRQKRSVNANKTRSLFYETKKIR